MSLAEIGRHLGVSRERARQLEAKLAQSLGAQHLELDLDALVEQYRERVESALGRRLNWEDDDLPPTVQS